MKTEITWTDEAWDLFGEARNRARMMGAYYGDALYHEHMAELLSTFAQVTFAAGPVNVQRDGDGFYITTPHIVIGLVWSPDRDEEMLRRISPRGDFTEIASDWPRTGRWSAHS